MGGRGEGSVGHQGGGCWHRRRGAVAEAEVEYSVAMAEAAMVEAEVEYPVAMAEAAMVEAEVDYPAAMSEAAAEICLERCSFLGHIAVLLVLLHESVSSFAIALLP